MPVFAIGVDLGGTNLRVAAIDESGEVLKKVTLGTEVRRGRDLVISEMCQGISEITREFTKHSLLAGIGIGVPGIIDLKTGLLRHSPNLPGWHDYPVRAEIERRLSTSVILENDANVAALGEKWLGAAATADDMCMLTLGTGVGGGIILGGKLWHGGNGFAGEIGHITVYPEGHACGCGNQGCLEQYASATAIRRLATDAIENGRAPTLKQKLVNNAEVTAEFVYQMANQGDRAAQEIFHIVGRALGIAIASLINILDLPMFVIGGGVASGWEAFRPALIEELRRRSYVYKATSAPEAFGRAPEESSAVVGNETIITQATLGGDAGLIGAARLVFLDTADKGTKTRFRL